MASIHVSYKDGIISTSKSQYQPNPKGAGHTFFEHMKKYADKILQIDGLTGEEETFGSVLLRSTRIALKLQEYGIKPNDTVSICTNNNMNCCIPVFASLFVGANVVSFDDKMDVSEATLMMQQVDPKIVFVCPEAFDFMKAVLKSAGKIAKFIVFGSMPGCVNFLDLLTPHHAERYFEPVEVNLKDIAFTFFTSGSTGMPKAIHLSHQALLGQIAVILDLQEPFERLLMFSSMYWATHIFYLGVVVLKGFSKIVINFSEDVLSIWRSIELRKPTYVFTVPYIMKQMIDNKPENVNIDSIRKIYIGGGPTFDHQLLHYRKSIPKAIIVTGYGITEAGLAFYFPSHTEQDLKFIEQKTTSIGRVLNEMFYKVVDADNGKVLGPFQQGELLIKTKNALTPICQEELSVFTTDGWLKTGDMVYYDEDYCFYHVERLKRIIKCESWYVPPKMIEDVLLLREDIKAVCVIGVQVHSYEHPLAIIQLTNQDCLRQNLKEDICEYVEKIHGKKFKLRGGVKFVNEIPLTPNGKFNIRRLKSQLNI